MTFVFSWDFFMGFIIPFAFFKICINRERKNCVFFHTFSFGWDEIMLLVFLERVLALGKWDVCSGKGVRFSFFR